ncbi:MAG TPA: nucleotidyltransferase domain-containing protein [Stellaceae bacterium]|nr:nucleotidyltransferase domain-containing protein [Stellaceae bacterium]
MLPVEAERLIGVLSRWVERQHTCRAMAVVGSWARGTARSDSDLDLLLLTNTLDHWSSDADWLPGVGLDEIAMEIKSAQLLRYGATRSWHIQLSPPAELELTFADLTWANLTPIDPGSRKVVSGGIRITVDKDKLLATLKRIVLG